MRAVCSTLVVLVLLFVGGRPPERHDLRERKAQLDVAPSTTASAIGRRQNAPDNHVRLLFIAPSMLTGDLPPQARALVREETATVAPLRRFARTRSSRGPPVG